MPDKCLEIAMKVLNGGMAIFDKHYGSKIAQNRRIALTEKAKALCNFDRLMSGDFRRVK